MSTFNLIEPLSLPQKTLEALKGIALPANEDQLRELFFSDPEAFQDYAAGEDDLVLLRLYLEWMSDTKAKYEALNIPAKYFRDSMRDIPIWCDDYLQKHQSPGFKEWAWVGRSLRMEVIRIGRLQFEPSQLLEAVSLDDCVFPVGTPVLEVHIPAGEPLDIADVQASFALAPLFFKTYFGAEYSLFHCHSWLLSPSLKELLPEQSRIIHFQNLFTIYHSDNEERQAEDRIFGFLSDDPNAYPESTSLQKAFKQYMLSGKTVMMGAGVRIIR